MLKSLYDVFGRSIVYQPLAAQIPQPVQDALDSGMIRIHTPFRAVEDKIAGAFNDYRQWAQMNRGSGKIGRGVIRTAREIAPFFSETSVSQIRADFKKHKESKTENRDEERMVDAGLFAAVAGEYDFHNLSLETDLESFKALEANLARTLKGNHEPPMARDDTDGLSWSQDPGAYMTSERIKAWATLYLMDDTRPDFFVTTSTATAEHLFDRQKGEGAVFRCSVCVGAPASGSADTGYTGFLDRVKELAVSESPDLSGYKEKFETLGSDSGSTPLNIDVFAAIDQRPADFFTPFCRLSKNGSVDDVRDSAAIHTVLCCIKI